MDLPLTTPREPAQQTFLYSEPVSDLDHLKADIAFLGVPFGDAYTFQEIVNDQTNIAGAGINIAQRVMDCGDAGHILLSKRVAEDLKQYTYWQPHLQDLGECEVKHGVRIGLANLFWDDVGNPSLPSKLRALRKRRTYTRWAAIIVGRSPRP